MWLFVLPNFLGSCRVFFVVSTRTPFTLVESIFFIQACSAARDSSAKAIAITEVDSGGRGGIRTR